jgi:hypothetical protein
MFTNGYPFLISNKSIKYKLLKNIRIGKVIKAAHGEKDIIN